MVVAPECPQYGRMLLLLPEYWFCPADMEYCTINREWCIWDERIFGDCRRSAKKSFPGVRPQHNIRVELLCFLWKKIWDDDIVEKTIDLSDAYRKGVWNEYPRG